jgi:hypothetical protein
MYADTAAGIRKTAKETAPNDQRKALLWSLRLSRKFQVAWNIAEAMTSPKATVVMGGTIVQRAARS